MRTLIQAVEARARDRGETVCVRTYSKSGIEVRTFGEVFAAAGRAASFYDQLGIRSGDTVAFVGTHHIDLYAAWLGCVWVGAIPTVLAEPAVRVDPQVYRNRLDALLARIRARALMVDPRLGLGGEWAKLPTHGFDVAAAPTSSAIPLIVEPTPDSPLLMQHSSGTTGLQKGVVLSHGMVWRHVESHRMALGVRDTDVVASWLPLFHDMGLMACFVGPLYDGIPVTWLSPFEWVLNPLLLTEAVEVTQATLAWLPNFAFALLAQRAKRAVARHDLSSLRAVINCSEPVTAAALQVFQDAFAGAGLRPGVLRTSYAMAENVFAVSLSGPSPVVRRVDRQVWTQSHVAAPGRQVELEPLSHVSSGRPVAGVEIRIGPADAVAVPLAAGPIWIRSPFLFTGYHSSEAGASCFDAEGFFDTGDLGYVDDQGELFVTGRAKDIIIAAGRNVYPQDIEEVVNAVPGVHEGRAVCFGVPLALFDTEGIAVAVETDAPESGWVDVSARIRAAVPAAIGLDLVDVRIVARGSLRKSTSGKLDRRGNRELYLTGVWGAVPASIATRQVPV